ncbi:MAG: bifunctional phosphopantothenoylcysteine decarboxylase/phosphopantothenate--cysteine ligase CoaBC [Mitsuokella sp.]
MTFAGKNIVLGVTGSIAAYKAVEIASRLKKAGASIHVIMTREAKEFVTELTFREITGCPVASNMWDKVHAYNVEHIALAKLADLVLVAPATANVIAKLACGIADDMLTATLLATRAPIVVAPAMNTNMYENRITQRNLAELKSRGIQVIEPASGQLACGTSGKGRLPEPHEIIAALEGLICAGMPLAGTRILVTAGGTIEPLDPVRYLGNRSTGRMGYAIAAEAVRRGAAVTLISGPSVLPEPAGVSRTMVETAREMHDAVLAAYNDVDVVIKAAAVADYRPKTAAKNKIKKQDGEITLVLTRNPDILLELGEKKQHQILVGFAAETQNIERYAREKLQKKNLDFLVANDVSEKGAGFGVETNHVKLFSADGSVQEYPLMQKQELAGIILDHIAACLEA